MRTVDYLKRIRELTPTGSVYAAAQLLGLPEGTVRAWHLEQRGPDALACVKIAELLDLPIEQVLADIQLEREKDPDRRAYWEGLARKFAACVAIALVITITTSGDASATGPDGKSLRAHDPARTIYELCDSFLKWLLCRLGFGRFPGFAS